MYVNVKEAALVGRVVNVPRLDRGQMNVVVVSFVSVRVNVETLATVQLPVNPVAASKVKRFTSICFYCC